MHPSLYDAAQGTASRDACGTERIASLAPDPDAQTADPLEAHPLIEAAREYLQARQEHASIRILASHIGVYPSTLHNFLSGAHPQPRIRRKILDWYGQQTDRGHLAVRNALAALLVGIPERERDGARRDVLRALADAYRRGLVEPPVWTQSPE
jgi:hypothetical protein